MRHKVLSVECVETFGENLIFEIYKSVDNNGNLCCVIEEDNGAYCLPTDTNLSEDM